MMLVVTNWGPPTSSESASRSPEWPRPALRPPDALPRDLPGPDLPPPDALPPELPGHRLSGPSLSPELTTPDAPSPDALAPELPSPELPPPDLGPADAFSPDALAPDARSVELASPVASSPELPAPDLASADVFAPDALSPDALAPELPSPDPASADAPPDALSPDAHAPVLPPRAAPTPDADAPVVPPTAAPSPELTALDAPTPDAPSPDAHAPVLPPRAAPIPDADAPVVSPTAAPSPELTALDAPTPDAPAPVLPPSDSPTAVPSRVPRKTVRRKPRRKRWRRKHVGIPVVGLIAIVLLAVIFGDTGELGDGTSATTIGAVDTTAPETAPDSTTLAAPSTTPPAVATALERLDTLTVADHDPDRDPYERNDYQPAGWADLDGDCITTRDDILIAQSRVPVVMSADGCRVEAGEWVDAYTGTVLTSASDARIDHFIPFAEGHRSGGWRWDAATKVRFANDTAPGALLIVARDINQAKGDSTPDKWLPPWEDTHCGYALNWVDKKARWGLTVTPSEQEALRQIISGCTLLTTPDVTPSPLAEVSTTVPTTASPTTTVPPSASPTTTIPRSAAPADVVLVSCNAQSEEVTIANRGGRPADLSGFTLHDQGNRHSTTLGQWGPLAPGTSLTITSGENASEGPSRVVWKREYVWTNDGDVAFLVGPAGQQSVSC